MELMLAVAFLELILADLLPMLLMLVGLELIPTETGGRASKPGLVGGAASNLGLVGGAASKAGLVGGAASKGGRASKTAERNRLESEENCATTPARSNPAIPQSRNLTWLGSIKGRLGGGSGVKGRAAICKVRRGIR